MPEIGAPELLVVLVLALVFLGPKRLPEAGRALGKGIREFRDGVSGAEPPEPVSSPTPRPTARVESPPEPPGPDRRH